MPRGYAFRHSFRVRYAEVDAQAVAFNSRYLEYADIILTEFWRERGVVLFGPDVFETHVVKATVEYVRPMRFDEEIDGWIAISKYGNTSLTFRIELHRKDADDLRAVIELVHVHVDLASGRSLPVPDAVRAAFGAPLGND